MKGLLTDRHLAGGACVRSSNPVSSLALVLAVCGVREGLVHFFAPLARLFAAILWGVGVSSRVFVGSR